MKWCLPLSTCILLIACYSTPPCLTPALSELRLRWGIQDSTGTNILGYELTSRGELFRYHATGDSLLSRIQLGRIKGELYCRLLSQAHHAFLTVQAFYVPADTQRFVEYRSPTALMRIVWNPRYRTHGNELFWALYDSLETARLCCVR